MKHVREQIRTHVFDLLSVKLTGTSVFNSLVYDVESGSLPACKIYSLSESSEFDTMTFPRGNIRKLQVIVEVIGKANANIDNLLDRLCAETEVAITEDVNLGGLTKDISLEVTTIELNDGGENPHGMARMSWIAEYRIKENDPYISIL